MLFDLQEDLAPEAAALQELAVELVAARATRESEALLVRAQARLLAWLSVGERSADGGYSRLSGLVHATIGMSARTVRREVQLQRENGTLRQTFAAVEDVKRLIESGEPRSPHEAIEARLRERGLPALREDGSFDPAENFIRMERLEGLVEMPVLTLWRRSPRPSPGRSGKCSPRLLGRRPSPSGLPTRWPTTSCCHGHHRQGVR